MVSRLPSDRFHSRGVQFFAVMIQVSFSDTGEVLNPKRQPINARRPQPSLRARNALQPESAPLDQIDGKSRASRQLGSERDLVHRALEAEQANLSDQGRLDPQYLRRLFR